MRANGRDKGLRGITGGRRNPADLYKKQRGMPFCNPRDLRKIRTHLPLDGGAAQNVDDTPVIVNGRGKEPEAGGLRDRVGAIPAGEDPWVGVGCVRSEGKPGPRWPRTSKVDGRAMVGHRHPEIRVASPPRSPATARLAA